MLKKIRLEFKLSEKATKILFYNLEEKVKKYVAIH